MKDKMDTKIVEFIKQYQISNTEIKDMLNIAPMLEFTTWEEFVINCKILVKNGYIKEDLDYLIMANPNVFCMSSKDFI